MEETLSEGAMQYRMNGVIGKFYMLRISKQTNRASGVRN
jgi:hypothetical protein